MNEYKLSYYTVITDILDEEDPDGKRIIFSTRTGKALIIKDKTYQDINNSIFDNLKPYGTIQAYRNAIIST